MKSLEKQWPSKVNFSTFLQLIVSNFRLKLCEFAEMVTQWVQVTQTVKEIRFNVVSGKLEAKSCFNTQSLRKYFS